MDAVADPLDVVADATHRRSVTVGRLQRGHAMQELGEQLVQLLDGGGGHGNSFGCRGGGVGGLDAHHRGRQTVGRPGRCSIRVMTAAHRLSRPAATNGIVNPCEATSRVGRPTPMSPPNSLAVYTKPKLRTALGSPK